MTTTKTLFLGAALCLAVPFGCDSDSDSDDGAADDHNHGTDDHGTEIPSEYEGQENPVDGDAAAIEAGMMSYASLCANCHGDTGAGDGASGAGLSPLPTDFTTRTGQADDLMLWAISDGVAGTGMPGYASQLTQDQIWEVVSYIRTLQ